MASFTDNVRTVRGWSPIMFQMALVCLALAAISLVGLAVDDRVITGAPAWLKPTKFGLSGVVYLISLAAMVHDIPKSPAVRRAVAACAVLLALEVALIVMQAARGTTSHFNIDTTFDAIVFQSMGVGIATVWIISAMILYLHWRTPAVDRAMALALRLGLALNILGAGVGWRMTTPDRAQIDAIKRGERPRIVGAHSVGGTDGGPGLPITRWNTRYGDLRVPHFLGMHALQLLPLLLLGLRRARGRTGDQFERTAVIACAGLSAAVFALALAEALAGHPFVPLKLT
jgi:hypothetical protein